MFTLFNRLYKNITYIDADVILLLSLIRSMCGSIKMTTIHFIRLMKHKRRVLCEIFNLHFLNVSLVEWMRLICNKTKMKKITSFCYSFNIKTYLTSVFTPLLMRTSNERPATLLIIIDVFLHLNLSDLFILYIMYIILSSPLV